VPLVELGQAEVLSLPEGAEPVNKISSCGKRRPDVTASQEM